MKNEFHSRRKHLNGFAEKSLITLALVFAVIVTMPFLSNASELFNKDAACSLTVTSTVKETGNGSNTGEDGDGTGNNNPETSESFDIPAEFLVDLYLVADVLPYENSDGYYYKLRSPYEGEIEIGNDMTAADWRTLSQVAARIALGVGYDTNDTPVKTDIEIEKQKELDGPGLYLLIVRGNTPADYVTVNDNGEIITQAYSGEYIYTFLPELVSVPGKEPDEPNDDGTVNTADPGKWIYDVVVTLKPERRARYGSLKIIKTLKSNSYDADNDRYDPATFVFQIEAVLDGKNVYSDVVSVVFDEPGVKEILVEKIPVGAEVTVTEVYSGASYKLITKNNQQADITADTIASLDFTNDHDDRRNKGHSITNHFSYETTEGTDQNTDGSEGTESGEKIMKGTWKLDQIFDVPQSGEE